MSGFSSRSHASTTDANASLISITSRSSIVSPVRSSRRRVASIGPVSMSTGSTPTRHWSTTRARDLQAELAARAAVVNEHRGRAVGDLRRRSRGVHAVLARDGLQLRERLERRLAQPFVAGDVMGRAGRLAVFVDVGRVDRHDLALEATLGPGPLGAHLRLETELVGVGAGDAPLVGDAFRALELRRELVVLAVRRRWSDARSRRASRRRAGPGSSTRRRTRARRRRRPTSRARPRGSWPAATIRTARRRCVPATSSGRPALSHALRAMLKVCSPTWLTQPPITWPTSAGSMPDRSMTVRCTVASRSTGCTVASPPLRRPSGERAASTMTTSWSAIVPNVSSSTSAGLRVGLDRTGGPAARDLRCHDARMRRLVDRRWLASCSCSPRAAATRRQVVATSTATHDRRPRRRRPRDRRRPSATTRRRRRRTTTAAAPCPNTGSTDAAPRPAANQPAALLAEVAVTSAGCRDTRDVHVQDVGHRGAELHGRVPARPVHPGRLGRSR